MSLGLFQDISEDSVVRLSLCLGIVCFFTFYVLSALVLMLSCAAINTSGESLSFIIVAEFACFAFYSSSELEMILTHY